MCEEETPLWGQQSCTLVTAEGEKEGARPGRKECFKVVGTNQGDKGGSGGLLEESRAPGPVRGTRGRYLGKALLPNGQ